jgi:hypothetical protein
VALQMHTTKKITIKEMPYYSDEFLKTTILTSPR